MQTIAEQVAERMQLAAAFEDRIECDPAALRAAAAGLLNEEEELIDRLVDEMDRAVGRLDRAILRRLKTEAPETAADCRAVLELFAEHAIEQPIRNKAIVILLGAMRAGIDGLDRSKKRNGRKQFVTRRWQDGRHGPSVLSQASHPARSHPEPR